MAQVLSALALSTKEMQDGQISGCIRSRYPFLAVYGTEKFLKKLAGKTDVEDALRRLDRLTNEENLLVAARTLGIVVRVDDNVTTINEVIQGVDGNVRATKELTHHMDQNIMTIKEAVCDVGVDVKSTKDLIHRVDDNVTAIRGLTCDAHGNMAAIRDDTRRVNNTVESMRHGAHHLFDFFIHVPMLSWCVRKQH